MDRKNEIKERYKKGSGKYDELLSTQSWWARLGCKVVWGFPDTAYAEDLLDRIPDDFSGKLLDIPVGTGLFTAEKYGRMKKAEIICADYSPDMLALAQNRFDAAGLKTVRCVRADVGNLPFPDESFDTVLSMNGFHAFPDKEAAYRETYRALKPGGCFIGCFYIKGEVPRTDMFIRSIYVPKGYFTPPFHTKSELLKKLGSMYENPELWTIGGIACFRCKKNLSD